MNIMRNIFTVLSKTVVVLAFSFYAFPLIACSIDNLYVEAYTNCNADGTFDVDIEFTYNNVDSLGFDLFVFQEILRF